jgi:hypothetical protein
VIAGAAAAGACAAAGIAAAAAQIAWHRRLRGAAE